MSSGMGGMAGARTTTGSALDEALSGRPQKTPAELEAERKRNLRRWKRRSRATGRPGARCEAGRTLERTVASESMAGTGLKPEDVSIDYRATTCPVVGHFAKRGDAEDWALFYVTSAGATC